MDENTSEKINEWINSGEYKVDIDEIATNVVRQCSLSKTESETSNIFENELYFVIRQRTGIILSFEKEKRIDNIVHSFGDLVKRKSGSGRLDTVVNNLIIEYKHHSKLASPDSIEIAVHQVIDYLVANRNNTGNESNAILTDGTRISYFMWVDGNIRYSSLSQITGDDIDNIIKAIIYNCSKKFVPLNILHDFSINQASASISKSLAICLYKSLCNNATDKTKMLYEEWKSLMHLSIEDNGKGNDISKRRSDLSLIFSDSIDTAESEYKALYALQTTYAIIVKLIACKVVDNFQYNTSTKRYFDLSVITSDELQKFFEKVEDGYSYQNNNVNNFLEGDFFSWYSDKEQWDSNIWSIIIKVIKCIDEYSAFSFNLSYNPIDIFKDLYMATIPKSIRHSMGEYFTPEWLADYVITEGLSQITENNWKAIDPCCGSGIFLISLIKHIVGDVNIQTMTNYQKEKLREDILSRVYGIDINPLSVLSARVGYYLALQPFGLLHDSEIPVYLGDSAIIPTKITIGGIICYTYSVNNLKKPFNVIFPERFVKMPEFGKIMSKLQTYVKTDSPQLLFAAITEYLSEDEKKVEPLIQSLKKLSENLSTLHKNHWDGIWIRIATNFMLIARLSNFNLIVGNPPWVKWEHLPAKYAERIKNLCSIKHIFSFDGQYGGTQLNICALISNVVASNWLSSNGVLAFLMPDSIMAQNSYEEFRNFYLDYNTKKRLYIQKIDKWEAPLRPFKCEDKVISQAFNTYYFSSNYVDYRIGIPVKRITRRKGIKDDTINSCSKFEDVKDALMISDAIAIQYSPDSTAFSYKSLSYDFSKIIGKTAYNYRTGVEFTPQELFILTGCKKSTTESHYRFRNKKFSLSKYIVDDAPINGWDLPTKYIYPILRGPSIVPFKYKSENDFCILPYDKNNTKEPISSEILLKEDAELLEYLVRHKSLIDSQSEKSKQMHRGDEFYSLSKVGPYTFAENIVAVRDNTSFCATVVNKTKTPWGEEKQTICVKHTIVIGQDKDGNYLSNDEAHYICGILNSNVVVEYIHNTFKKNSFSLNKSHLYLPKYDETNAYHIRISELARKATNSNDEICSEIQKDISELYLKICESK